MKMSNVTNTEDNLNNEFEVDENRVQIKAVHSSREINPFVNEDGHIIDRLDSILIAINSNRTSNLRSIVNKVIATIIGGLILKLMGFVWARHNVNYSDIKHIFQMFAEVICVIFGPSIVRGGNEEINNTDGHI